jgi:regulatory protein
VLSANQYSRVQKSGKQRSSQEIRQQIYAYCAYQERSHREVRQKLYDLGLYTQEVDETLAMLITEGYLNEERFAKAFAGGKFRIKGWGRVKIIHELEARGLTKKCIHAGMLEIPDDDYVDTLTRLLEKKSSTLSESNLFKRRDKLAKFAIAKGYESDLVWKIVNDIVQK